MRKCCYILLPLLVALFLTACAVPPPTPESDASVSGSDAVSAPKSEASKPASSASEPPESETSKPEEGTPVSCERYFETERYLPALRIGLNRHNAPDDWYYLGANGSEGGDYFALEDHSLYRHSTETGEEALFLAGDYRGMIFFEDVLYLYGADGAFWRVALPDGEPELLCTIDAPLLYNRWQVYGDELIVCPALEAMYAICIPTGEARELGRYPASVGSPDTPAPPAAFWMLTNRSYCYQLPQQTEEGVIELRDLYLWCGSEGTLYEVTGGFEPVAAAFPPDTEAIEAFYPLDDSGTPLLGDQFTATE